MDWRTRLFGPGSIGDQAIRWAGDPDRQGRALRATKLAAAFLTVIPIRFRDGETTESDLADSRLAYPLIGLAIGLGLALLSEVLRHAGLNAGVTSFLLLACWVAISGALHLDGLADTADGLFLYGDAERRLKVMRDPRIGTFGVVAIVLVLLGKYACLQSLGGSTRSWAILGAPAIGRSLVVISAGLTRYARPEGTGRVMVEATTIRDAYGAGIVVLALSILTLGAVGLVAAVAVIGLAFLVTRVATSRLGGVTGDTLGALVELGELLVLLSLALSGS